MYRFMCNSVILAIAMSVLPTSVFSEGLSKQQCKILLLRKKALVKAGAVKNMSKGAAWAKKNLSEPALVDIKNLIEISEQLLFRCGQKRMQHVDMRNRPVPKSQLQQASVAPETLGNTQAGEAVKPVKQKSNIPLPQRRPSKKELEKSAASETPEQEDQKKVANVNKEQEKPASEKKSLNADQILNLINDN